jgi:hypothetical protein
MKRQVQTVVVIEHHKKQERKRLSANHKIAKMTTNNTKTFNNESTNEPERIIVGYTDDQKGKDIRDEDVVRVSNGKWIAQHSTETGTWREKSTGWCPTYRTCSFCFKAGPTGKKCVCTDGEYKIVFYRYHIIDSIKIAELLEEELEVAKADCMQNWIMTPSMQLNLDCCDLAISRRINRENASLSNDDKKALKLKRLTPIWDLTSESFQFC